MTMTTPVAICLIVVLALLFAGLLWFFWRRAPKKKEAAAPPVPAKDAASPPADSLRDAITGLYNRKHLLRRLQETMARCERSQERFALLLWDIDGFIGFNNRYGQKKGDLFLKKVADIIRGSLRVYDEAFRSGADEFCAILFPSDDKITAEVSGRVRQTVSQSLFQDSAEYADHKFSISSGVVYYPSGHRLAEALLYAAGEALYKSKNKESQT